MAKRALYLLISLLLCGIPGLQAGNAPVCTIGVVETSDSLAVVPVKVINFNNIGACDLKISFNAAIASLEKITFGTGVLFAAFNYNKESARDGVIRCGGYFNNGVTLPDSSVFLYLHFKQKANGSTPLTFIDDDDSYSCLFYDDELNPLNDNPLAEYYVNGMLSFVSDSIDPIIYSEYTLSLNGTAKICEGQSAAIQISLQSKEPVGEDPYQNVLLKIFSQGPGDVSFSLNGDDQDEWNFVNSGSWGPSGGFTLFPEFYLALDGNLSFSLPGNYTIFLRVEDAASGGLISGLSDNLHIQVADAFSAGSISTQGEKICSGESAEALVGNINDASGGDGAIIYQWQKSVEGDDRGFEDITGAVDKSYLPSGPLHQTTWYRRMAKDGLCSAGWVPSSGDWEVTVYPVPEPSLTGAASVCALSAGQVYTTQPGMLQYAWSVSGGAITSGGGTGDHSVTVTWNEPGTGQVTVNYTHPITGCRPDTPGLLEISIQPCSVTVSGRFSYFNNSLTPLEGVTVYLGAGDDTLYSAVSDQSGQYLFPSVEPGDYFVWAALPALKVGTVNTVDAGALNKWQVGPILPIEKVRFIAGDVDGDRVLSSGDAARINNYFLHDGHPGWAEPAGPWCFWKAGEKIDINHFSGTALPVLRVGNVTVKQDFFALTTGDFNMSFVPEEVKKNPPAGSVTLKEGEMIDGIPGEEFILPISAGSDMTVGAFSLILGYPQDWLEVITVFRGLDLLDTVPFNLLEDQLRIGWFGVKPMVLKQGQPLVSIKVKVRPETGSGSQESFFLINDRLNELADEEMKVMPNAVLKAAGLTILATNTTMPDQPGELRFTAFPNPASSFISMEYDAPDRGIVTIRIFDPAGKTVKNLQMNCSSGRNKFLTDVTLWSPGIYLIRVDYNNYYRVVSFSEKIVIWR